MEKNKTYYTYCIRVTNRDRVLVERRDAKHQDLGRRDGAFRYQQKFQQMEPLLAIARDNSLNDALKARALGEALFDLLFDDVLLHDFVEFYDKTVQQEKQLLRVELDIDEGQMPEVAALPWEFLRVPAGANLGTIWMGTLPDVVFYRRRPQWNAPKPIQLEGDERLKIALVVSAPPDLKPVAYERVEEALEKLAKEQPNRIELLPIVNSANPEEIDAILSQKPHIFHFIGHGRLRKEGDRDVGEIALVDLDFDEAMWVDADYFSGLFGRHRPSVVMLQACEGGKMSEERAFTGVASGIIQQNIPVVVAMQYEVTNSTASRFSCRFYQRLAEGEPVDIAAQDGRYAIALGPTQYSKRDFATPVIFMAVEDGYLFKNQEPDGFTDILFKSTGISRGQQENSPDLDFSKIPPESIQQAYRKALPPDANLWGDLEANNIYKILEKLKDCRQMGVFYELLSQDENIVWEMRQKFLEEAKKHPQKNNNRQTGNFFYEEGEFYLIATLKRAEGRDVWLNGWLVRGEHKECFDYVNNCRSLLNGNETESGVKCPLNRVENILDGFIEKSGKYLLKKGVKKLTIEIFLPMDLLDTEVEWWNLTYIGNEQIPIGTKFPVRLRSVERLSEKYLTLYLFEWREKWKNAKLAFAKKPVGEDFGHFDLMEDESFTVESLIYELDNKIGLKSTSCPPQQKRKDLFKAILRSALPIALWTRYNCPNRHNEIEKLLYLQALSCLCDSIKKKRMEAVAQRNDVEKKKHLGSHLALIWENPYRLPPDVIVDLIPPGE